MACEAFDKTDFHSKKISVGDKLPPGQIPQNYIARAAITANIPQKPTFPRPAKESKVIEGSLDLRVPFLAQFRLGVMVLELKNNLVLVCSGWTGGC